MLKKFLSILGSITITTSSAIIVSSCKKENKEELILELTFNSDEKGKEGFLKLFEKFQEKGVKLSSSNNNEIIYKLEYFNSLKPNEKIKFIDFKNKKINVSINDDFGIRGHQNWIWCLKFFKNFKKFFNETKNLEQCNDELIYPLEYNIDTPDNPFRIYNFTIKGNKNDKYFNIFLVKYIFFINHNNKAIIFDQEKLGKIKIEI